jgi:hypothetical protein
MTNASAVIAQAVSAARNFELRVVVTVSASETIGWTDECFEIQDFIKVLLYPVKGGGSDRVAIVRSK